MTDSDPLALAEEAEALDRETTPGPWNARDREGYEVVAVDGSVVLRRSWLRSNAAFAARARTLLPSLAAAVRRLVEEREEVSARIAIQAATIARAEHEAEVRAAEKEESDDWILSEERRDAEMEAEAVRALPEEHRP